MRWLVRIGAGLLMLIVALVGVVFLIPSEKVADVAAAQFFKATGRTLTVEGGVSPSVWPVLGVKTGLVRIANADWSREGPMLEAEALAIGVDMASLFKGDIKITKIEAIRPQIILERNKDGAGNWEIAVAGATTPDTPATGNETTAQVITLDHGVIEGGSVLFLDHSYGTRMELRDIAAEARLPDFAGPATLNLSGVKDGVKVVMDARVAAFDTFLAGTISDVTLNTQIGGSEVGFDGRIGTAPLVAEGALTADFADLAAVAGVAGQAAPALPQGLGATVRKVSGTVTLAEAGSLHLRGGLIELDSNRFSGDLDMTFDGARPKLTAKITAGALDFSGLAGDTSAGGSGGGAASGWSRDLIDVSGLGALDASVALTADSIDLGTAKLGRTRLLVTLDRARMVIESQELQAYGGNVTGNFVVNGRGGLSVGGDLRLAGIAMQPLLQDVADFDRLIGTGDISLKFLGVGNRMSDIMNSLSGDGSLRFGKGELRGLDLAGMLRSLDVGYVGEGQKTIFDAITGSFTMKDGVLRNDDLQFSAPYITAAGTGRVGIGARDLDYRLTATALAKSDGTGGVTVPLLISGPWAKPKFRLDMQGLIDQNLAEEKERLKEKARAEEVRAKAKLEKELGIQREEGERLEDAAKRRAQEALEAEAARALKRLLGGN
ncbi:AsmA family protein [Pseudorhodobacter turbinis]|uniref:AsmA family protein n=1 Tax=Pseudorhodobacter turbinis TaxID=2500533 RepID=A0A4P8EGN6_9RHOB|nr:AsmA family protein [Pseudorhodobacter turbinis]QCO55969.1 AsmA family protein [Pseudorhodobacter turbinis]